MNYAFFYKKEFFLLASIWGQIITLSNKSSKFSQIFRVEIGNIITIEEVPPIWSQKIEKNC
jgi:hypothetical protein